MRSAWILVLLAFVDHRVAAQPPHSADQRLHGILDALLRRGEEQERAMHQRALDLLKQAEAALKAGKNAEARDLAFKATRLDGNAAEVQEGYRRIVARLRERRDEGVQRLVIQDRLREALERVEELFNDGQPAQAKELAEAMRDVLKKLPAEVDAKDVSASVAELLRDPRMLARARPPVEAPAPDAVQKALGKRISVDWRNEPLSKALEDLTRVTGVGVVLDADLDKQRLGQKRIDLLVTHGTTQLVLRHLTDRLDVAYVEHEGKLVLLSKTKAQRFVPSPAEPSAPAAGASEPQLVRPRTPPAYLQSGKAFTSHVEELLRTAK